MDSLPTELLRYVFAYSDAASVRALRRVSRTLAEVGYDFVLGPNFRALPWRNDIDRLHNIALHERLRGKITSVALCMGELSPYDARHASMAHHFLMDPESRAQLLQSAWKEYSEIEKQRQVVGALHLKTDDLREACSALPNLREFVVNFTDCPFDNEVLEKVFHEPNCRKLEYPEVYQNLDAIILALHGIQLSSFKIDRFPLEMFGKNPHRRHWFSHAQSFNSLSTLHLTLDPSKLQGPSAAFRSVNGLGGFLRLAINVSNLKIAFHPYARGSIKSKFALSFRECLDGTTFGRLSSLILEGMSCDEDDLKDFLARHGKTLTHLRLGGRGLAMPWEASNGGIHLYEGTFRSLLAGLRHRLPKLERLHLEGVLECEHRDLPSHEAYNFYPLTNEDWEDIPQPVWVRPGRRLINCSPFEQFVKTGGPYPGDTLIQQSL
ncbi:uncharacterized protein B0I36DRAFT_346849 [Microdochium trichocladiopsis]|uniref:F-box domain-containing protein n=1 Tax=Microdochium trichocladiopsis TaxID=1682393 RepID=A0A9P8Y8M0_9PEZI|nr:uncharacterized protein B0I36DRAFT_346849 [Microdochium trichocladiopsis]KAH7034984.1 hypothetical protein B0I36DRAFT_346849 [Microdochium trichocladiopsis]